MTGVELILLLIGSVFMVGSFFITERLSPAELNKIAELSEGELKRMIDSGLENAEMKIEDAIDEQIMASADKVDRALEKETNDKIMAISEYSDTVIEGMNKTHNEIMFLYSMLNDKHTELTGMASDLQRLAADVRNLEENMQVSAVQPVVQMHRPVQPQSAVQTQLSAQRQAEMKVRPVVPKAAPQELPAGQEAGPDDRKAEQPQEEPAKEADKNHLHKEILKLHKEGMTEIQIARKMNMGVGEIRLIIGLYRGE